MVSDQRLPPKFSQQISREHIEDLVQAITEVQSSVSLSDGRTGRLTLISYTVLQIRTGNRDNLWIIFNISLSKHIM